MILPDIHNFSLCHFIYNKIACPLKLPMDSSVHVQYFHKLLVSSSIYMYTHFVFFNLANCVAFTFFFSPCFCKTVVPWNYLFIYMFRRVLQYSTLYCCMKWRRCVLQGFGPFYFFDLVVVVGVIIFIFSNSLYIMLFIYYEFEGIAIMHDHFMMHHMM